MTPLQQKCASAHALKCQIFSYYKTVDKSGIWNTLLCAFLLLPIVLHDTKSIYRIIMHDSSIENVADDTSTLIIKFIGNPFGSTELYICRKLAKYSPDARIYCEMIHKSRESKKILASNFLSYRNIFDLIAVLSILVTERITEIIKEVNKYSIILNSARCK